MFLINSRRSRFTVAQRGVNRSGHPLSRTYGVILQSSLTTVLPSALDYSSRLPVSVLVRSQCFNPRSFSWTSFRRLLEQICDRSQPLAWGEPICLSPTLDWSTDISDRTA